MFHRALNDKFVAEMNVNFYVNKAIKSQCRSNLGSQQITPQLCSVLRDGLFVRCINVLKLTD